MLTYRTFRLLAFILLLCVAPASRAQSQKGQQSVAQKIEFYKQNVRAIVLIPDQKVVKGHLSRFSKAGIIFNPTKSSPFYDPGPTFYPISQVEAFLDAKGRVLWSRPNSTYSQRSVRRGVPFRFRIGLQYGMGKYLDSYNSPISTPAYNDYVQDINTGGQASAEALVFLQRNVGVGLKYVMFSTSASYHGLTVENNTGNMPGLATINEDMKVNTVALYFAFYQPVTAKTLFHADLGVGQSNFSTPGSFLPEPKEIAAAAFSAYIGTGFDYSITRALAVGFDVSLLLGGITDQIDIAEQTIEFKQNLNRLDINAGIRLFF